MCNIGPSCPRTLAADPHHLRNQQWGPPRAALAEAQWTLPPGERLGPRTGCEGNRRGRGRVCQAPNYQARNSANRAARRPPSFPSPSVEQGSSPVITRQPAPILLSGPGRFSRGPAAPPSPLPSAPTHGGLMSLGLGPPQATQEPLLRMEGGQGGDARLGPTRPMNLGLSPRAQAQPAVVHQAHASSWGFGSAPGKLDLRCVLPTEES